MRRQDHTFDRKRLPRPRVQVESTTLLMLPTLIEQTGLSSFISRHHLEKRPVKTIERSTPTPGQEPRQSGGQPLQRLRVG